MEKDGLPLLWELEWREFPSLFSLHVHALGKMGLLGPTRAVPSAGSFEFWHNNVSWVEGWPQGPMFLVVPGGAYGVGTWPNSGQNWGGSLGGIAGGATGWLPTPMPQTPHPIGSQPCINNPGSCPPACPGLDEHYLQDPKYPGQPGPFWR